MAKKAKKRGISRASAKAKGREGVLEVIALIRQLFPELGDNDVYKPTGSVPGEDVVFSPFARGLLPISIEVKRCQKLNIYAALEQAESNSKDWQPVVMFRKNNATLYAAIDAAELLALLRIRAEWEKGVYSDEVKGRPANGQ